jgi:antitoxin MazE
MQARIQKWGNSLALRIPKSFALESRLEKDTLVDVSLENGKLIVTPITPTCTLEQLLAEITPENLHTEQDYGLPMGREAWE